MLADRHRYRQAALIFRRLLDEKPDATRVRLELARVLLALGDEAGARRQASQARATGVPPDVAAVIDRFTTSARSIKRFGGSFEASLAPDSNINRSTSAQVLDTVIAPLNLSATARAQSGLGLRASGQTFGRLPLATHLGLLAEVSMDAGVYRRSEFNDISASILVGPEISFRRDRVRPALALTERWYGGRLYAATRSLSVDWHHALDGSTQVVSNLSYNPVTYPLNRRQSGAISAASVSLERALTPRMGGALSVAFNRQSARDSGYAYTSAATSARLWRETGRMTLFGQASVSGLTADARLFPFIARRQDRLLRLTGGVVVRRLQVRGFAPVVRLTQEWNHSSVSLYAYRRTALEIGINRAF